MNRKNNLTPDRGLELQLASIPGISAKMARAVCEQYPTMIQLCQAYANLSTEDERRLLLSELSFRGTSGKDQKLKTRASKIYEYISGQTFTEKAKKPKKARRDKSEKSKQINSGKKIKL